MESATSSGERTARILNSMDEVDAATWNRCASPSFAPYDPFLNHAFLQALEESGSATSRTDWQPFHVMLEDQGEVLGVVPAYLKGHSQGEYVFDHAWADAWHRAGGDYYPKMQSCIPFTPATNAIVQQFAGLLQTVTQAAVDNTIDQDEAERIRKIWDKLKTFTEGFVNACEERKFEDIRIEEPPPA